MLLKPGPMLISNGLCWITQRTKVSVLVGHSLILL